MNSDHRNHRSDRMPRRFACASIIVLAIGTWCGSLTPQSQAADETIYAYWGGPGSSFNGTIKVRFNQPGVDYTEWENGSQSKYHHLDVNCTNGSQSEWRLVKVCDIYFGEGFRA